MDIFSPEERSRIMGRVRSENTKPEMIVRSLAHRQPLAALHAPELQQAPAVPIPRQHLTASHVDPPTPDVDPPTPDVDPPIPDVGPPPPTTCPELACAPDDICVWGACQPATAIRACPFDPMQWWRDPVEQDSRSITFVAFGDTHATDSAPGCDDDPPMDQNYLAARALDSVSLAPHTWPSGFDFGQEGQVFNHVRGLIILGDLVNRGSESAPAGATPCRELRNYRDAYGRCGDEGRIRIPVYDVYGNHEFPRVGPPGDRHRHPVIDHLDSITAEHRPGGPADTYDDPDPGTGHYAWRWDDVWFVNLNVKPGGEIEELEGPSGTRIVDPHHSRSFFVDFLLARTRSTSRQIVALAHYPMWSSRVTDDERTVFCRRIHQAQTGTGDFNQPRLSDEYPIMAYLHGHIHKEPRSRDWTCPAPYDDIVIPHYNGGSPNFRDEDNDGHVTFTVFRIGTRNLEVVGVGAPADDPTGPWRTIYGERRRIVNPR